MFNQYLTQHKSQIEAALPKHLTADRMARLALTCFSQNKALSKCSAESLFSSIIIASQLGLEVGVAGQGYLVPYKGTCQFIPGWQGYVDLVARSGRASVWTQSVYQGDEFDYSMGTDVFVKHKPGDDHGTGNMTHVYAIGRVNGCDTPVIEVWSTKRVEAHRDKFNKVGNRHYSFNNFEMYARKIPLLQVIKYMPKSIEVSKAMEVDRAHTEGQKGEFIDGDFVIMDGEDQPQNYDTEAPQVASSIPKEPIDMSTPEKIREAIKVMADPKFDGEIQACINCIDGPESEKLTNELAAKTTSLLNK